MDILYYDLIGNRWEAFTYSNGQKQVIMARHGAEGIVTIKQWAQRHHYKLVRVYAAPETEDKAND